MDSYEFLPVCYSCGFVLSDQFKQFWINKMWKEWIHQVLIWSRNQAFQKLQREYRYHRKKILFTQKNTVSTKLILIRWISNRWKNVETTQTELGWTIFFRNDSQLMPHKEHVTSIADKGHFGVRKIIDKICIVCIIFRIHCFNLHNMWWITNGKNGPSTSS